MRLAICLLLPLLLSACVSGGGDTDAARPRPGPYVGGAAGGGF